MVEEVSIFARVSPQNKLDILKALKKNGHVVAMTGDGVNDAPAIKASDVGVSMGIRGTDVTKETSDIVLLDDNFATIRDSIREGRRIFDNVRKFVNYLLSCNLAEVMVVFIAGLPLILGKPQVILTAVMLLWINIVTDGLPALALGVDPAAAGILKRKPRPRGEGVINKRMSMSILFMGFAMGAIILFLFYHSDPTASAESLQRAQTIAFTSLVFFELVRIQAIRGSEKLGLFSNKYLFAAVAISLGLQLMVLYTPLNAYFRVTALGLNDWALIGSGLVAFSILTILYNNIVEKRLT
jgi:Ca2+-transporting ATPase